MDRKLTRSSIQNLNMTSMEGCMETAKREKKQQVTGFQMELFFLSSPDKRSSLNLYGMSDHLSVAGKC